MFTSGTQVDETDDALATYNDHTTPDRHDRKKACVPVDLQ